MKYTGNPHITLPVEFDKLLKDLASALAEARAAQRDLDMTFDEEFMVASGTTPIGLTPREEQEFYKKENEVRTALLRAREEILMQTAARIADAFSLLDIPF